MFKKGQAAMEFLMTYGWAILAAIIAIGVLAYFGVFNPSRLAGSTAVINAPLNIPTGGFNIINNDAAANNCAGPNGGPGAIADCINIQLIQNAGQSINVASAVITLTSGGTGVCTNRTTLSIPTSWQSGTSQTVKFGCATIEGGVGATNIFGAGDSIAGNLEVKYTVGTNTIVQSSTGNVRGVSQ